MLDTSSNSPLKSTSMDDYQFLIHIERKHLMDDPISTEDIETIFTILEDSILPHVSKSASFILATIDKTTMLRLIDSFDTYSQDKQDDIILNLACTDYVESYVFLLKALKKSIDKARILILTIALSKTTYFIFPLILAHLQDRPSESYLKKLKDIIQRTGFYKLKPYMMLFPILPEEWVFREVFGHELMNTLHDPNPTTN